MAVGRDYLLRKPGMPSSPERLLHTQIVPAAANVAGLLEGWVERAADRTGVRPAVIVVGALSLASFAIFGLARWSPSRKDTA
jgi:hypothetical protein